MQRVLQTKIRSSFFLEGGLSTELGFILYATFFLFLFCVVGVIQGVRTTHESTFGGTAENPFGDHTNLYSCVFFLLIVVVFLPFFER